MISPSSVSRLYFACATTGPVSVSARSVALNMRRRSCLAISSRSAIAYSELRTVDVVLQVAASRDCAGSSNGTYVVQGAPFSRAYAPWREKATEHAKYARSRPCFIRTIDSRAII